jgi:hypothetical protein
MTPQQKARRLLNQFYNAAPMFVKLRSDACMEYALQCSLICVRETIQGLSDLIQEYDIEQDIEGKISYWIDVENEINKI